MAYAGFCNKGSKFHLTELAAKPMSLVHFEIKSSIFQYKTWCKFLSPKNGNNMKIVTILHALVYYLGFLLFQKLYLKLGLNCQLLRTPLGTQALSSKLIGLIS